MCGRTFSRFIRWQAEERLCPFCGSLARNRRLWTLLNETPVLGAILDFSPSRALSARFSRLPGIHYVSTDFSGEFPALRHYDITRIDTPGAAFDIVICYHVLEHVPDDTLAMREMFRVLKPGGIAYVQTPFRDSGIHENPSCLTGPEREKEFGQKDHVRIYSAEGLAARLRCAGFRVEIKSFDADERRGLMDNEKILLARKPA